MRTFGSLCLIVSLAVCYLMFFRSQAPVQSRSAAQPAKAAQAAGLTPEEVAAKNRTTSQYKADMDRAHAVASQMKAAHADLNSF